MDKPNTKTDALLPELANWTLEELRDLQSALAGLIEAANAEPEPTQPATATKRPSGSIELKWIRRNGKQYGPYRYLRYWEGKTLKSKYLGRASHQKADAAQSEASEK
jgi:hypothetical protein